MNESFGGKNGCSLAQCSAALFRVVRVSGPHRQGETCDLLARSVRKDIYGSSAASPWKWEGVAQGEGAIHGMLWRCFYLHG